MRSVKIDYIFSFSNEDPDHPASNLLVSDMERKWLCNKGESSCSVVLQLESACKIDMITIGAYDVALIEILVGLSDKPNDPYEVLLRSCRVLSPDESRRGAGLKKLRSFVAAQMEPARERRWDLVKLVCSQPYNKHCKYGLTFVHISSPEASSSAARSPSPARAVRAVRAASSSDEEFRPGELFVQQQRSERDKPSTVTLPPPEPPGLPKPVGTPPPQSGPASAAPRRRRLDAGRRRALTPFVAVERRRLRLEETREQNESRRLELQTRWADIAEGIAEGFLQQYWQNSNRTE